MLRTASSRVTPALRMAQSRRGLAALHMAQGRRGLATTTAAAAAPTTRERLDPMAHGRRGLATTTAAAAPTVTRKRFDPNAIFPSKPGVVRICSNTTRDAQQSNLSAEMAESHRLQIGSLIDACYATTTGPPGVEQIWGGTVPMFDIWKRGAHPFASLRALTQQLPNTPTSMLVRSDSLNSMAPQPRDVVDEFIRLSSDAGIDVFTNFDAHNDARNHVAVAEAVHRAGRHYQAALAWAIHRADPTVYNIRWAVNWFRRIVRDLSPHSLYIKDPSGVLTPEMAGLLAKEIKGEFPDLPLVFHAHYQVGYTYAAYLEALKNGANAVECSLGFPDGAGQPYALTMLRMAEDYGLDTGNPNKAAWDEINKLCRNQLRFLYPNANVARTPDIDVERTGIAGGQRTILDAELTAVGQAHLIPKIDEMVQQVRREGGLVCQVTPAADSYAREAMRRIRGGDASRNFAPGYANILVGECGATKEPVDAEQRRVALDQRLQRYLTSMVDQGKIDADVADVLQMSQADAAAEADASAGGHHAASSSASKKPRVSVLAAWRARMDELAAPVLAAQREEEVSTRIEELRYIASKPELQASLTRKIERAQRVAEPNSPESRIGSIADRLAALQSELASLRQSLSQTAMKRANESYHALLLGSAPDAEYEAIARLHPVSAELLQKGKLTLAQVKALVQHAGAVTCSISELLPPGLDQARRELEAFDREHVLGLLDSPQKAAENTLLWACFSHAAIPNLIQNFFLHYYTGDIAGFFPKLFKGDRADPAIGSLKAKLASAQAGESFLYRAVHRHLGEVLAKQPQSAQLMAKAKEAQQQALMLGFRAQRWADGTAERLGVAADTRKRLDDKIASLQAEAAAALEQLDQMALAHIRAHPGQLLAPEPQFDAQKGGARFVRPMPDEQKEMDIAKQAIRQLVQNS